MRNSILTLVCIASLCSFGFKNADPVATKKTTLTVSYSFKGIAEGYDHKSKTEVYIDGTLAGTSSEKKESDGNSFSVSVNRGQHTIKVINYAFYENEWQMHTIEEGYSIDATYEEQINLNKKKYKLELLFDIDKGTSRI